MKIILYLLLFLTLQEIQQNIKNNFSWINDVQGNMEIRISLSDTTFSQSMKFYMENSQEGKRIKIESNGEKVMLKNNKMFFKEKSLSFPQIPDTGNIFPEGEVNINSRGDVIEIECTPQDTTSGILNYKFYVDKNTYNIKISEITTKFGVIYTNFEYQKYSEGYFYKKVKTLSQKGIVTVIEYKDVEINKGIPESFWK